MAPAAHTLLQQDPVRNESDSEGSTSDEGSSSDGQREETESGHCLQRSDACCSGTLACKPLSKWALEGQRAKELAEQGRGPMPQEITEGTYQGTYVTAKYWGITMTQLRELYEECQQQEGRWDRNDRVSVFLDKFVIPKTTGTKMGYALWLNHESPKEVTLMISHAWSESINDFFQDVLEATYEFETAFICFLSNYQGSAAEIARQLGEDIHKSPFTQVISNPGCQRMLVVPNDNLKEEGLGLYSRLWCDWEIKCAADVGLPIHMIEQKREHEYLFGRRTATSRDATCGNLNDRRLIERAINDMPPHTRSFLAASFEVVTVCCAFGPVIGVWIFKSWVAWASGFALGLLFGLSATVLVGWKVREWMNPDTGHELLDSVIREAANGRYSCRAFHVKTDMIEVIVFLLGGGVLDFLGRIILVQIGHMKHDEWKGGLRGFVHFLEGMGAGLLLWIVLHPNKVGPWTNVFILRARNRFFVMALFLLLLASVCLYTETSDEPQDEKKKLERSDCVGEASLLTLMMLLSILSFSHLQWLHGLGLLSICGWMYFTLIHNPAFWRETLLLAAGTEGIWLTSWSQRHVHIRILFTVGGVAASLVLFFVPQMMEGYNSFWRCDQCFFGGFSCDIRAEE